VYIYIYLHAIVIYTFDLSGGIREIALRIFPCYPVPINNNKPWRARTCVRSFFSFWYFNSLVFYHFKCNYFLSYTLSTVFIWTPRITVSNCAPLFCVMTPEFYRDVINSNNILFLRRACESSRGCFDVDYPLYIYAHPVADHFTNIERKSIMYFLGI
jgi:hypothetical protein